MKAVYFSLIILILLIAGCSQTIVKYQCANGSFADNIAGCTAATCPATDCPKLDCSVCPVKIETKTETKTVTERIYVCADLREVDDKIECIPKGDNIIEARINSHTTSDIAPQGYSEAMEGFEYHTFDVTVQNKGAIKILMVEFKVKDNQGYIYESELMTSYLLLDRFPTDAEIAPGDFITGKIIFQTRKDATLSYLMVEGTDTNYKTTKSNVNIG